MDEGFAVVTMTVTAQMLMVIKVATAGSYFHWLILPLPRLQ